MMQAPPTPPAPGVGASIPIYFLLSTKISRLIYFSYSIPLIQILLMLNKCSHKQRSKSWNNGVSYYHFSELLSQCNCGTGGGGSDGRVQWDPARDILSGRWPIVHYCIISLSFASVSRLPDMYQIANFWLK